MLSIPNLSCTFIHEVILIYSTALVGGVTEEVPLMEAKTQKNNYSEFYRSEKHIRSLKIKQSSNTLINKALHCIPVNDTLHKLIILQELLALKL